MTTVAPHAAPDDLKGGQTPPPQKSDLGDSAPVAPRQSPSPSRLSSKLSTQSLLPAPAGSSGMQQTTTFSNRRSSAGSRKPGLRQSNAMDASAAYTADTTAPPPESVFLPVEMADLEVGGTMGLSIASGAVEAKPGVRMHYDKDDGKTAGEDGGIYIGERKDGLYHGEGSLTKADASSFIGQWKEGRRHGRGTYTFPDGAIYSGMWKLGVPHGEGRYTWASGEYYDGNYNGGKREGYGTMQYRVDGKASDRFEGFWHQGYKEGRGRMTYGQLTLQKQLIATSEPFDKYTGEFKRGYRHGKGIYTFKDGSSFQGYYKYGLRHGLGVFFFKESFITKKNSAKDGMDDPLIAAYISEWEDGTEIPGAGLHTKMQKAVAKKNLAAGASIMPLE